MESEIVKIGGKQNEEIKRFQFIWSWNWVGIGRGRPYPYCPGEKWHGSVYAGGLRLGFLEIRKWCRNEVNGSQEF